MRLRREEGDWFALLLPVQILEIVHLIRARMSQKLLRNSFAASIAIAAFGMAAPIQANESTSVDHGLTDEVPQAEVINAEDVASSAAIDPTAIPSITAKVGNYQSPDAIVVDAAIATIYAHDMDGRPAATVYVRSLPVFTLLGNEGSVSATPSQSDEIIASGDTLDVSDPVVRATALAAQINQHHSDGVDAETINVRWDEESETFLITTGDILLLAMGSNVILPETTGSSAEDALHATNRLRRQMGGAEALSEVEGLPARRAVTASAAFSGMASWYGPGFHGRMSASGERFNQNALTAAHRTLPFGTLVEVVNLNNGASTIVRINDRGPFSHGRVIDLSAAAAREIGMMGTGVAPVSVNVLE